MLMLREGRTIRYREGDETHTNERSSRS